MAVQKIPYLQIDNFLLRQLAAAAVTYVIRVLVISADKRLEVLPIELSRVPDLRAEIADAMTESGSVTASEVRLERVPLA